MAFVDLMVALSRAEDAARKSGRSFAIYDRHGVFIVEALSTRTGFELEIVKP